MTDQIAAELLLDNQGADAFLRLSRGLPALASDLSELSKSVADLGKDIVAIPSPGSLSPEASLSEVLSDLKVFAKALSPEDRVRVESLSARIQAFKAWRTDSAETEPQDPTRQEPVGIFLRLPPSLAAKFPDKSEDDSPPHSTILMVGDATHDEFKKVVSATQAVAACVEPFDVEVTDYGEFENAKGQTIPHMIPRGTGTSLEDLHKQLRTSVESALGRKASHFDGPFKPHVTLGYVEKGQKYEGPRPSGKFKAGSIEVWGAKGGQFGRSVVQFGSGNVEAHLPSNKADMGTGDLSSGGALGPQQGGLRRDHNITPPGPCGCDNGKLCTDHAAEKAGAPFPKKKPDGKFLESDEESGSSGSSGGSSGVSMSAKNLEVPQDSKILSATIIKRASDDSAPEDQHTVLGIVLEPETVDAQNDIYSAAEIEQTAWKWAEQFQQFGLMHNQIIPGVLLLETYVAPVAFDIAGRKIKKGTWLLRGRVVDETLWAQVKSGALSGWSIGGFAQRTPAGKR